MTDFYYRFRCERMWRTCEIESPSCTWAEAREFLEARHGMLDAQSSYKDTWVYAYVDGYIVKNASIYTEYGIPTELTDCNRLSPEDTMERGSFIVLVRKPVHNMKGYRPRKPAKRQPTRRLVQTEEERILDVVQSAGNALDAYSGAARKSGLVGVHPSAVCKPLPPIVAKTECPPKSTRESRHRHPCFVVECAVAPMVLE